MAVLSEPKRTAYIIKENYASTLIQSKIKKAELDAIRKNAELFKTNNCVQMRKKRPQRSK